jgi:thioredoxin-dependent peroxiredoxin
MAVIKLKGKEIHTKGEIPKKGAKAPDFTLVSHHLEEKKLSDFKGKKKLILTVPSLDTDVCASCAKRLNSFAIEHPEDVVIIVSADLPFAQKRFCSNESLENIVTLSMMKDRQFAYDYGVLIEDGPLEGICARALFVVNSDDTIVHTELVPEIAEEPNYDAAFALLTQ